MKKLFLIAAVVAGSLSLVAQDTTPPTIVSLDFTPKSVDVTVNPQTVAVTMNVTDDLSGVKFITATFTSPTTAQRQFAFLSLSSGTSTNGTFTGSATIPKFVESGNWTLSVFIGDNAGNSANISTATLAAHVPPFPTLLAVVSNPDTTAPTVTGIAFSSSSLDVSAGPQTLTVTLTLTDSPAGVSFSNFFGTFPIVFQSPSGKQHQYIAPSDFTMTTGNVNSGTWQAMHSFPRYSESGVWTIATLTLQDAAGNQIARSTSTLTGLGLTDSFTMVDTNPDTMPPSIISFDFSPKLVDTSAAAQTVTVTANITDDLSGVDFSPDTPSSSFYHGVRFTSPSHGQSVLCCAFSPVWTKTGGTTLSGTWQAPLTIPQFSEQGTWKADVTLLKDAVQNTLNLTTAQMAATPFFFPTDLVVVKPSLTSDGTVGPGGGTVMDTSFGARAEIIFPTSPPAPSMVSTTTTVAIDVFSSPLDIPNPNGFSGPGTLFVDVTLTPIPTYPFPAPGVTLVLPVSPAGVPGTPLSLFSVDPVSGTLVPVLNTSGTQVVGTIDAGGLSATFLNVSHLSIFVGLIPAKTDQATLTVTGPSSVTFGTTGTATASGGSGTGALSFSAGASTGCSVSGSTVSVTDASGSCSLTATKAGDATYNPATSVPFAVTLVKADQATLTVTGPSSVTFGTTGTATASGGSGTGALSFSSGASTGCSVSGATVSVTDASGSCTLTATKAADNNYKSTTSAPFTVTLVPATGAAQMVTALIANLSDPSLGLTKAQISSLTDKLNNVLASIQAGLNKQAINQLNAFISSVQSSFKTGKISLATANTLIGAANAIIAVL